MSHGTAEKHFSHLGGRESLTFVRSHLPTGTTILDVGCGTGLLAKLLSDDGFTVKAIDHNAESVEAAKRSNLDAECIDFLQYQTSTAFDAVLFSRSLHHIHPAEAAVAHAHKVLKPGGLVLVDDFGAELVDEKTAVWFYGLKSLLLSEADSSHSHGPKLENGEIPANPVQSWRDHHFKHHDVAESPQLLNALSKYFEPLQQEAVPYLYRYFLDDISPAQAEKLLRWETQLCKAGAIVTVGMRFAGKKRETPATVK